MAIDLSLNTEPLWRKSLKNKDKLPLSGKESSKESSKTKLNGNVYSQIFRLARKGGKKIQILKFIFEATDPVKRKTEVIHRDIAAYQLNMSINTFKVTSKLLQQSGLIKIDSKLGAGGGGRYSLSKSVYDSVCLLFEQGHIKH